MKKRFLSKYDGKKREWFHSFLLMGAMLIVVFIILQFVFGISTVSGNSMEPTMHAKDVVLYLRLNREYSYGDIVALKMPSGEKYIKRVIGLPEESVDIRDGIVYIDEEKETGGFAHGATAGQVESISYPYEVQPGRYFVLGDNRAVSIDSRTFETVSQKQIMGRVILVLWRAR